MSARAACIGLCRHRAAEVELSQSPQADTIKAMNTSRKYLCLREAMIEAGILGSAGALLGWDELTYMPSAGAQTRAKQVSLISRMNHELFVAPKNGEMLEELSREKLEDDAAVNVREWLRMYRRKVRVPASLIQEMSHTAVLARQAWGEARRDNDYSRFLPHMQRTIDQRRRLAECLIGGEPQNAERMYDALLDEYEPYETTSDLKKMFGELKPELQKLMARVSRSGRSAPVEILRRDYPLDKQKAFSEMVAARLGFDFTAGRLDTTLHPFCCTIGPGDVRLTTRYARNDFGNCFFSVIHETGHGLYEQGLPAEHWCTPLGEAVSLGVHESQSRLWENAVCRGEGFWRCFYPMAQEAFPHALADVKMDDFALAINAIRPSLIRTEADEVSYNLHIIIRFELELALLWGDLSAADLPGEWNRRMNELLGQEVPDDSRGCLQDVHWSQGAFGYFPTYTLGNVNAAALMEAAGKELGDWRRSMEQGDFTPLLEWLRRNIHRHGQRYPARELVSRAVGQERSIKPLINHLQAKVNRWYA